MDRHTATKQIRQLAQDETRVFFTEHAKKRNPQEGKFPLTKDQVLNCLTHGYVKDDPVDDIKVPNGKKCTITRFVPRECHEVVVVFVPSENILVITAYECGKTAR
ncbi:DUF4258 domain-containing protein [Telmatospirillum sp. J64-1]|uniref:DUF4258 domain-containing protein n=1 Tax=Telmatospirillum sp. J64-1 TaxID=2502183 RepID=UPI00115E9D23|nr:DUF4258 domain-containing protein [Telmatospirillum sp. J64-1]